MIQSFLRETCRLGIGCFFQSKLKVTVSAYYSKHFLSVFFTHYCLFLSSALAQDDFLSQELTPTAIAIGGSFHAYATLIINYLMHNNWSHVSILIQSGAFSPFYKTIAASFMTQVKELIHNYTITADLYPFLRDKQSMIDALEMTKLKSRGNTHFRGPKGRGSCRVLLPLFRDQILEFSGDYTGTRECRIGASCEYGELKLNYICSCKCVPGGRDVTYIPLRLLLFQLLVEEAGLANGEFVSPHPHPHPLPPPQFSAKRSGLSYKLKGAYRCGFFVFSGISSICSHYRNGISEKFPYSLIRHPRY